MSFENRLPEMLDDAIPELATSVDDVITDALARGYQRRRRRRVLQTATVSLSVVALSASGLLLLRPQQSHHPVAATPTAATSTQSAADSAIPTPRSVARKLTGLLSRTGRVSDVRTEKAERDGGSMATVVYDDGHGKVSVAGMVVSMSRARQHGGGRLTCESERPPACGVRTLADRAVLLSRQTTWDGSPQGRLFVVEFARKDGVLITVANMNAGHKAGPATRRIPPLTLSRLVTIAMNGGW